MLKQKESHKAKCIDCFSELEYKHEGDVMSVVCPKHGLLYTSKDFKKDKIEN